MLAPQHPAVAPLPRAYRTPLHLRSCADRLEEAVRFFDWLHRRGTSSLTQIDTQACEAYLAFRRYVLDENGVVGGEQSPAVRRAAAQVVVDLVDYRELFTADRVRADLRPWGGASASAVAEMPSGRTENKTPPVTVEVLQPMLAAALHLVTVFGPHAVELEQQVRQADRISSIKAVGRRHSAPTMLDDIGRLLTDYVATCTPLPMIEDHDIDQRIAAGWSPDDPLLPVVTGVLARQVGYSQLWVRWIPMLRRPIQDAVASVGVEKSFARQAAEVPTADNTRTLAWTLPLHRPQAIALVGIVRTAAIIVLAAASGMRASELMELRVGCRRPIEEPVPGIQRFRIASKVVKGQPLGGTDDEWVVIEPVCRAVELAEQLRSRTDPWVRAVVAGPAAHPVDGRRPGRRLLVGPVDAAGGVLPHHRVHPAPSCPGLLRGPHRRQPRSGPPRPGRGRLRPADPPPPQAPLGHHVETAGGTPGARPVRHRDRPRQPGRDGQRVLQALPRQAVPQRRPGDAHRDRGQRHHRPRCPSPAGAFRRTRRQGTCDQHPDRGS